MTLSKSKKVKLTKNIVLALADEEWVMIDFTLKQFGLPITDDWTGDKKAYLVEMLSGADDDSLRELAAHCDGDDDAATAELPYWKPGKLRVFLSHLSAKKEKASELQTALEANGMCSFVAHKDIHPTAEWQAEIETALQTCDLLIALVYPKFHDSDWCDQEIGWALGRGIPVFTIRLGSDPKGFVSRFQAFTGNGKTAEAIGEEILDAAITHKVLQEKIAEAIVTMFVESAHFHEAKSRIAKLEKLNYWDTSFSKRIKKAVKENYEISHAFGVPERAASLLKKWKA